jgi:hypothetical protein
MVAIGNELFVHHAAMTLSAGNLVRVPWHIQNANAYHGRLNGWMHRFRGVATSHLENAPGWFPVLGGTSRARNQLPPC